MTLTMKTLIFSLLLLSFLLTTTSYADMYKWKDEKGVIHYAQLPPPGQEAELIGAKGKLIKKKDKQANKTRGHEDEYDPYEEVDEIIGNNETAQAMAEVDAAVALEKAKLAEENAAHCKIAKSNLISLESRPLVRITENGKTRILSQSEKKAQIEQNRTQIKQFCK